MSKKANIISFSLYGNDERYTKPLLSNAHSIAKYYPAWTIYVYHDRTVEASYVEQLKCLDVVTINVVDIGASDLPPKLWRFLPTLEDNIECILFRDADSLFSLREVELVSDWMKSNSLIHIIRDHPLHIAPIMAGMLGVKEEAFAYLAKLLHKPDLYQLSRSHDYDQILLADHLYPAVYKNAMIHTSFFKFSGENIIKIKPAIDGYIGEVVEESLLDKQKNKKIIESSKFIYGVPYYIARLFRYRVRPVLYTSYLYNFIVTFFSK